MNVRRTTVTATLLSALVAGGVLLASAGTASAQSPRDRAPGPVPGMAAMHQQMTAEYPGMGRMHALMTDQNPGMARMHDLMTDGPR